MRASKKIGSQNEIHISGAEGLYEASDMQRVVQRYIERALTHPKGKTDKIIITIEDIRQKPEEISTLPVATIRCRTPGEGKKIIIMLLQTLGISKKAVDTAFEIIKKGTMRGAAIITTGEGNRLEYDRERGVRASRFGISKSASKVLSSKLSRHGNNTDIVREALILASKVVSFRDIVAELCVSDDPYYTTGYIASKQYGYLRMPNIKSKGSKSGGRAFFIKEKANVKEIINYLERVPVKIVKAASCKGVVSIDEILNRPYL